MSQTSKKPCDDCEGTGKGRTGQGGRYVLPCRTCRGTGLKKPPKMLQCGACAGTGVSGGACTACMGAGEIPENNV